MNWIIRSVISGARQDIGKCMLTRCLENQAGVKNDSVNQATISKPIRVDGPIFVAAHVGSGFCRAAIICSKGKVLHLAVTPCRVYKTGIFSEMSSYEVWKKLVKCIKEVTDHLDHGNIQGMGFTAIPALVCLDAEGNPVTASTSRDPNVNIILHYDNRSMLETEKINKTRHELLRYFGETAMADFQESKLMWIKNNLKEDCWDKAEHFLDLSDFLTWKATGSFIRSSSSLVSQWSYEITVSAKEGWNAQYFDEIGIPEVKKDNFRKIGSAVQRPGIPLPEGLLEDQAREMGLRPKLTVATGMPDGLAGCLGLVGCNIKEVADDLTNRLCIVFGTRAASHFILSRDPHFVKGIKGPFRDSVLPNMWLNHAGQTTAESVLDYIIDTHPATPEIKKQIGHMPIHTYLNKILKIKAQRDKVNDRSFLTKNLHVLPDYDGNKSPFGDPWMRGMVSGLSITHSQESLALLYLAVMQSLAYSSKHIISTLSQNGHDIRCLLIGGSLGRNSLFAQLHKDVCQLPIVIPDEHRSKLRGAAILAGIASNTFRDFNHAIQEMCGTGHVKLPAKDAEIINYHEKKYQVFLKMYDDQLEYRRIMSGGDGTAKEMNANI